MPGLGALIASAGLQTLMWCEGVKPPAMGNNPRQVWDQFLDVLGSWWINSLGTAKTEGALGLLRTSTQTPHPLLPLVAPHPQGLPQHQRQCVGALHTHLCLYGSRTQQVNGQLWKPPTTANDQPQGDFFSPLSSGVNCQPLLLKTPLSAARLCFSAWEEFL